jgi:hypothetical protein
MNCSPPPPTQNQNGKRRHDDTPKALALVRSIDLLDEADQAPRPGPAEKSGTEGKPKIVVHAGRGEGDLDMDRTLTATSSRR